MFLNIIFDRSGTEEEFDEKQRLLTEVDQLEKEGRKLKANVKDRQTAIKIREAAMRTGRARPAANTAESGINTIFLQQIMYSVTIHNQH